MKILILNLPGRVLKSGSRWYNVINFSPARMRYYPYPWFMGYATSLLKANGFTTKLIDALAMELDEDETLQQIDEFAPTHIVCEPTWASKSEDRAFLDRIDPSVQIIAVGNYATNYPRQCVESTGADVVAVGEYEFALLDYLKFGCRTLPPSFISEEKPDYVMPELVEDLDLFPFPERDDVPFECYNEPSCYGRNIVMVSSRGCRLRCSFCNVESLYGRHMYRKRSPKNIVDEIVDLQKRFDFDEIYFDDDNMVANKRHIDGVCHEIIRRDVNIRWLCMGDGLVDDETLDLLAQAGCVTYKFGLEHLDKSVLASIPKPYNPKRLLELIRRCRELGMRSYVNLMIGLPGSTFEKDLDMVRRVIDANPDLMQFSIATPYPGTPFFEKAKEMGWLRGDDPVLFDATGSAAVSYPEYSSEKIEKMFHFGWNLWYRHLLTRKWDTLFFFLRSEIRRHGVWVVFKKIIYYLIKILSFRLKLRKPEGECER